MITITEKEFTQLAAYIKDNYGINLKEEKQALVNGRLGQVLVQNGLKNFTEYYEYVISDKTGKAAATLMNKMTTNHTFFMRETEHFNYFRDIVLPHLSSIRDKDLRVWSAGCSTGEEPYTLAMTIRDFFASDMLFWDSKILATDLSENVLDEAIKGVYSKEKIESLPSQWKTKYFKQYNEEEYILTDIVRNEVIFRRFNLMENPFPFKRKFHVIFCRNVMIYFDNKTKIELINKFYNQLEVGGYLFIGHSESIKREESNFKYIKPAVYRKI